MEAIDTKDWNDAKQLPITKKEEWTDNDGKGGKANFWSNASELCLVECHEGIQVGKYSAKYGYWSNDYIGQLEHVTKWKYLN